MRAQRARRRARPRRGRVHRKATIVADPPRRGAGAVEPGRFLACAHCSRPRATTRPAISRPPQAACPAATWSPPRWSPSGAARTFSPPASRRFRVRARRDRARGADAVPSRSRRVPRGFLRRLPRRRARVARQDAPRKLGGSPMFEFGNTRVVRTSPSSSSRTRRAPADAGGSDGVAEARRMRRRGRLSNAREDSRRRRRRRRVEPSRRVAMDASLRESSRIRIQFHEVGRRPRASRPLPRGRREEPPTKKIGAPRVAPRGDAPRANRRRAPAPVHGLGPGSRSAFGRDP